MDERIALLNKAELARRLKVSRELVSRWFRSEPPRVPDEYLDAVVKITGLPKKVLSP